MKKNSSIWQGISASSLLMILLYITLFKALHTHPPSDMATLDAAGAGTEQTYLAPIPAGDHCPVCDFHLCQHAELPPLLELLPALYFAEIRMIPELSTGYYSTLPASAFLRGPPTPSC